MAPRIRNHRPLCLLDDGNCGGRIKDNGTYETKSSLRIRFILGLGEQFTLIHEKLEEGNLAEKWKSLDLEKLIQPAKALLSRK